MVHMVVYRLHNTHKGNIDTTHKPQQDKKTHAQTQKNKTWNEIKVKKVDHGDKMYSELRPLHSHGATVMHQDEWIYEL